MTKLLNKNEHTGCPNFETFRRPTIEELSIGAAEVYDITSVVNKVVFVLEGQLDCAIRESIPRKIAEGDILFLPAGRTAYCQSGTSVRLLIMRINHRINLCSSFKAEDLQRPDSDADTNEVSHVLQVNNVLQKYLDLLLICHRQGLRCRCYGEDKVRELLLMLRGFYPKQELSLFFAPVLSSDTGFYQLVVNRYKNYSNMSELAHSLGYTMSGFDKKFRKVFECAPYQWVKKQKAMEAYGLVNNSNLNLKEISDACGFSSSAAFSKFFKQNFGVSPGSLRNKEPNGESGENGH